jgi:MarR family transcriptional regulator for hemolysin
MMEVERATAGRLLDRLEENGLVRREPDPVDRRVKRVFPTPSAATAQAKIRAVADKIVLEATRDLSDDQRETLMDLMTMVKGRLSEVVQSRPTMPETAAQSTAAE